MRADAHTRAKGMQQQRTQASPSGQNTSKHAEHTVCARACEQGGTHTLSDQTHACTRARSLCYCRHAAVGWRRGSLAAVTAPTRPVHATSTTASPFLHATPPPRDLLATSHQHRRQCSAPGSTATPLSTHVVLQASPHLHSKPGSASNTADNTAGTSSTAVMQRLSPANRRASSTKHSRRHSRVRSCCVQQRRRRSGPAHCPPTPVLVALQVNACVSSCVGSALALSPCQSQAARRRNPAAPQNVCTAAQAASQPTHDSPP